jgi:DNA-binding GntR family transcriptional regulator
MRGESVYKLAFNAMLQIVGAERISTPLLTETSLSQRLQASRTTVRKAISEMRDRELFKNVEGKWCVARRPKKSDYFPVAETIATYARVEKSFMEWMLRSDHKPGDIVNGLELARQFNVSTGVIREYLGRFSRFGLIERRPNSSWIIRGFTRDFALEIFAVRELFEVRSAIAFATLPLSASQWEQLKALEAEHRDLLKRIKVDFRQFSELDERFHRLINDVSQNRFIVDFYDIISLIFHYHYQWNKVDERTRNRAAILEHLDYIEALFSRHPKRIELACMTHLNSARKTLLASIEAPASAGSAAALSTDSDATQTNTKGRRRRAR